MSGPCVQPLGGDEIDLPLSRDQLCATRGWPASRADFNANACGRRQCTGVQAGRQIDTLMHASGTLPLYRRDWQTVRHLASSARSQ